MGFLITSLIFIITAVGFLISGLYHIFFKKSGTKNGLVFIIIAAIVFVISIGIGFMGFIATCGR